MLLFCHQISIFSKSFDMILIKVMELLMFGDLSDHCERLLVVWNHESAI